MNSENKKHHSPKTYARKQILWTVSFILLAILSVGVVMLQSRDFSFSRFLQFFRESDPFWLIAAFLSMLSFILSEAAALLLLCRAFGYRQPFRHGLFYSAGDIYFSAITPSATGGQPVSAYLMVKDGIPGMMVTVALVVNLFMYMLAIVAIGVICFTVFPHVFMRFNDFSMLLVVVGSLIQVGLAFFFFMLFRHERLLHRICKWFLHLVCKLRILKNEEARQEKLCNYMSSYREYSKILSGHHKTLIGIFFLNLLQRMSQISVTLFTSLAAGTNFADSIDLVALQGYVVLGANTVPIPGAMGISDYLMLDGFSSVMPEAQAVNLVLISRSFSFYFCVILCGICTLIAYRAIKKRDKKNK